MDRQAIEQQIDQLRQEANERRAYDEVGYLQKTNEANALQEELDRQEAQAAVIAEVQDPESSFVLSVGGFTVDFRDFARDEEAYQALAIATRLKLQELESANQAEQQALKDSYEAEKKAAEEKYSALAEEFHQTRIERNEFEAKWNNAANERDSLATENEAQKAEITYLKRQIEELRTTIQKPSVPTNLDSNALAEALKKANEAKPAVYNIREQNGHYVAFLAETDEEININWLEKGKYRVLTDEEAARFREEREEAQKAALESVPEVAVALEPLNPPQFQAEEPAVQGKHLLHGAVASEPTGQTERAPYVTWEAFESLTKAVDELYVRTRKVENEVNEAA